MAKRRNYEDLGDVELSHEDAARAEIAAERAEHDIARSVLVRGHPDVDLAVLRIVADGWTTATTRRVGGGLV